MLPAASVPERASLPRRVEAEAASMLDNLATAVKSASVGATRAENAQRGLAARTAALKVVHAAQGLSDVCARLRQDAATHDAPQLHAALEATRERLDEADEGADAVVQGVRRDAEAALAQMEEYLAATQRHRAE